ncbi:MAG: bifunctional adenosylcobinamide kinase/adenosylcobinamide-phosphate guanylyltransferase [Planctomycetota bacterium]|nr:bifunctional adenosylcobinamide kinase/adenosylcobinamide-phosphate guanylyltransferase [Planctomycetota bacterium]MDE1889090.1 bifunctional adenosylcobinamide kinase/adenosylcobinamide-phosphate guanylyltransferase [Planctomycetota bacterium]MDE2216347.1 bifunctional adenosylcobinamide kinase/adenosylcobinamide-phosphate guanylyltransferase [Planctomycetota bacterium]
MAKITLILGGARSGKSVFAEEIAKKYNDVTYIATAEVKDDEMRERIQVHRARRPHNWKSIEAPYNVDKAVSDLNGKVGLVFIDCITLYITNMLLHAEVTNSANSANIQADDLRNRQAQILVEIDKLSQACRESRSDVIIVSNEVGLGIVPDNALSRVFRDIAGSANQILADEADEVYFMVAGIAQRVK